MVNINPNYNAYVDFYKKHKEEFETTGIVKTDENVELVVDVTQIYNLMKNEGANAVLVVLEQLKSQGVAIDGPHVDFNTGMVTFKIGNTNFELNLAEGEDVQTTPTGDTNETGNTNQTSGTNETGDTNETGNTNQASGANQTGENSGVKLSATDEVPFIKAPDGVTDIPTLIKQFTDLGMDPMLAIQGWSFYLQDEDILAILDTLGYECVTWEEWKERINEDPNARIYRVTEDGSIYANDQDGVITVRNSNWEPKVANLTFAEFLNSEYNNNLVPMLEHSIAIYIEDLKSNPSKYGFTEPPTPEEIETIEDWIRRNLKGLNRSSGTTNYINVEYFLAAQHTDERVQHLQEVSMQDGSWVSFPTSWASQGDVDAWVHTLFDEGVAGVFAERGTVPSEENVETQGTSETSACTPMGIGSVEVSDEEVQAELDKLKQAELDEFKSWIEYFTTKQPYGYQAPDWFDLGDVPVYSVDLDENGNVIIGDTFKEALRNYLLSLADVESTNPKGGSNGKALYYTKYGMPEFLKMLGLKECPWEGFNYESLKASGQDWIEMIRSYANDDSKLDELIATFCKNIGSKDGKTVSLEDYYSALGNNGVYCDLLGSERKYYTSDEKLEQEAKVNAYVNKLQEQYPEVYDLLGSYLLDNFSSDGGSAYYNDGIVCGYSYIDLQGSDSPYEYPFLNEILRVAANITGDESYTEQRQKMTELFKKMVAEGEYYYIDITQLMNYLLGDNPEGVNYFDTLMAQKNAELDQFINTPLEVGTPDNSVDVEVYEPETPQNTETAEDVINDILAFVKNLLDPIYAKYFATTTDGYVNFSHNSDWSNPDSGDYAHVSEAWKDDETKEAFIKEVEAVIAQMLEKYSDVLTSVVFDGQRIVFTTIYDDENSAYKSSYTNDYSHDDYADTDNAHEVFGTVTLVGGFPTQPDGFEPAVDTPVFYTSTPKVVSNNIPENPPVGINGENLYKTAWDGIWASEDYLYIWDAKEQTYKAIKHSLSDLCCFAFGDISCLPFGEHHEIDNMLLSLVYGYNRTELPNVFEKDGKYYMLDMGTKRHFDGLERYQTMLVEITYSNSPAKSKTPASTPGEIETEETGNVVTDDAEEVTIKSEDCIEEMNAAAKKLGLTPGKTQGVFYQYSNTGLFLNIWDPVEKKFKAFSINSRNADGSINQEFTQAGKAINRTDKNVYYEAILEAYKNGYNFTVNYPWVCEKDGIYYEYDKNAGIFRERK